MDACFAVIVCFWQKSQIGLERRKVSHASKNQITTGRNIKAVVKSVRVLVCIVYPSMIRANLSRLQHTLSNNFRVPVTPTDADVALFACPGPRRRSRALLQQLVRAQPADALENGAAHTQTTVSHARPRNEVVDLDSRSVLPSGPWGLVVGFRRRGLVRSKD